jgi:polysaccharide export outer membrane protein
MLSPHRYQEFMGKVRTSGLVTFAFALFLALSVTVCAADDVPAGTEPRHLSVLGAGDSVSIQIFGEPETKPAYVADDGTVDAPFVGKVPVAGTSPVEAAARIAKALKEGGFFVDPHVTLLVTAPQSQLVSVVGEVQSPGRYPITPRTTLVDLLAQAGGTKETAANIGYVVRTDATGNVSRNPVNLNVVKDVEGVPSTWSWQGGDSLVIPRAEQFSIEGEVTAPGRYPIEPGMTVMQAVARAGGITERGSERRIQLKRADKPGQYKTLHAKPGDLLKAGDIILVKESIF